MSIHQAPVRRPAPLPWSVIVLDVLWAGYTAFLVACLCLSWLDQFPATSLPESLELWVIMLVPALTALNVALWHLLRPHRHRAG